MAEGGRVRGVEDAPLLFGTKWTLVPVGFREFPGIGYTLMLASTDV